jgi:type IV pilus assembly protein PilV
MPANLPVASSNRLRLRARFAKRQRGVGLVEVLMAVLVLSLGLLGISFVQARALANNNSSMGRSMAVMASYSVLEDLRAARLDVYANPGAYNVTLAANSCPVAGATQRGVLLNNWCRELGLRLGAVASTQGRLACVVTTAGTAPAIYSIANCTVTVQFDDSRIGEGEGAISNQQVITQAVL